jgi:hypothetical protein
VRSEELNRVRSIGRLAEEQSRAVSQETVNVARGIFAAYGHGGIKAVVEA